MIQYAGPANFHGVDPQALLGAEGKAARQWEYFEYRSQQVQMAQKTQQAFCERFHLVVEAGTGVGKSLAYLTAAADVAAKKEGRVVVSTYTLNLQQQLINKDIPLLQSLLDFELNAQIAKGRNHYLCWRRLDFASKRRQYLFEGQWLELMQLLQWAQETEDGSLSDLPQLPSAGVWQVVQSEHGNCKGRKCHFFGRCFYWKARRRLETADLIVTNHALLFSDAALKSVSEAAGILPEYRFVILDEAHNLEHVAEEHFGIQITDYRIKSLFDQLYYPRRHRGLLAHLAGAEGAIEQLQACRQAFNQTRVEIAQWLSQAADPTAARCSSQFIPDRMSEPLRRLRLLLVKCAKELNDEEERFELGRYIEQLAALEDDWQTFLNQTQPDCVYWVETEGSSDGRLTLQAAPLDVAPYIKKTLLDKVDAAVLTSATLSCAAAGHSGFDFFAHRIGLQEYQSLQLGSPFDYARQVRLYVHADMPDPNEPAFVDKAAEAIQKHLLETAGRAFVLFTSFQMLYQVADRIKPWCQENDIQLLIQGDGQDRDRMLRQFMRQKRCALLGADSFWQGVDVPGEALSNVIIVRLPFASPTHPLIQGRIEQFKRNGLNPFMDYQLPMAIIKFRQGFGRLIRTAQDRGRVVVLDSRIVQKQYGQMFLAALPPCPVEILGH